MAAVLRGAAAVGASPPPPPRRTFIPSRAAKVTRLSFSQRSSRFGRNAVSSLPLSYRLPLRSVKFVPFASSSGEIETTETEEREKVEEVEESQIESLLQDSSDGAVVSEDSSSSDEVVDSEEKPDSVILASLEFYREALANNDESKVAEIEAFLKSIEDEKAALENKVVALSAELSVEKDRTLRISADFDNFRKRTERERLSLVANAQGEVLENLLPVLDNFERAKAQIKVENEGEEKINNSYQSIHKQFIEILGSLGVVPVETVGNPFDPMLHEAIMREESNEYEEGIILDEYRKGFKIGDRLLRPAMVKVSAGPGPGKPEQTTSSEGSGDANEGTEDSKEAESS